MVFFAFYFAREKLEIGMFNKPNSRRLLAFSLVIIITCSAGLVWHMNTWQEDEATDLLRSTTLWLDAAADERLQSCEGWEVVYGFGADGWGGRAFFPDGSQYPNGLTSIDVRSHAGEYGNMLVGGPIQVSMLCQETQEGLTWEAEIPASQVLWLRFTYDGEGNHPLFPVSRYNTLELTPVPTP